MIVHDRIRRDADGLVNGRQQLSGMDGILQRSGCGLIALAVDIAALDPCPSGESGVAVGPVVAAIVTVAVSGGTDPTLRTSSKLSDSDYQSLGEQPSFVEVFDECGETAVEHRGRLVLHASGQPRVDVPGVIVTVGDFGPDDFDHSRSRFDQPASQQGEQVRHFARRSTTSRPGLRMPCSNLKMNVR